VIGPTVLPPRSAEGDCRLSSEATHASSDPRSTSSFGRMLRRHAQRFARRAAPVAGRRAASPVGRSASSATASGAVTSRALRSQRQGQSRGRCWRGGIGASGAGRCWWSSHVEWRVRSGTRSTPLVMRWPCGATRRRRPSRCVERSAPRRRGACLPRRSGRRCGGGQPGASGSLAPIRRARAARSATEPGKWRRG
jgi:hypothetical protein